MTLIESIDHRSETSLLASHRSTRGIENVFSLTQLKKAPRYCTYESSLVLVSPVLYVQLDSAFLFICWLLVLSILAL